MAIDRPNFNIHTHKPYCPNIPLTEDDPVISPKVFTLCQQIQQLSSPQYLSQYLQ